MGSVMFSDQHADHKDMSRRIVMKIDIEKKDGGVLLHLDGRAIGDSAGQIRDALEAQVNDGVDWILLDLEKVPIMDSSVLGTVIAYFLKQREKGGKLALLKAQKAVLGVLVITKLDSLLPVFNDLQTALDYVTKKE